jgi:hypothetical protein
VAQIAKAGTHTAQDLAILQHEADELMFMKAGLSQKAAHGSVQGVGRPLRSDVPLVFQGPPPGVSPKFLHDEYVSWVRPGAREAAFESPWSDASSGSGRKRCRRPGSVDSWPKGGDARAFRIGW